MCTRTYHCNIAMHIIPCVLNNSYLLQYCNDDHHADHNAEYDMMTIMLNKRKIDLII